MILAWQPQWYVNISFVFSCVQFILQSQKTKVYESQILQHNLMKEGHIQKLHKV